MVNLPGAVVAKKPIKLSNRVGKIRISFAINNVNPFSSMRVVKPETVFMLCWNGCNGATSGEKCDHQ